jgi:hypothetical protein
MLIFQRIFRRSSAGFQNRAVEILSSPFFLAIPLAMIVFFALNFNFGTYRTRISYSMPHEDEKDRLEVYHFLDSSNTSDRLHLYNLLTNATILRYDQDDILKGAWNLPGNWYAYPDYCLYDWNKNGQMELYSLCINPGDSVIVSRIRLDDEADRGKHKFAAQLKRHQGELDSRMKVLGFSEITGDRYPEFIFYISAGFTIQPRAVFAWDVYNDTILCSPFAGINYRYFADFSTFDINEDGIDEIFLSAGSTDNIHVPYPYPDTASYLAVLSENLHFLFPPVPIPDRQSYTRSFPMPTTDGNYVLGITRNKRDHATRTVFTKYDIKGNLLKSQATTINAGSNNSAYVNGDHLVLNHAENQTQIFRIDPELNLELLLEIEGLLGITQKINIDTDNYDELILHNHVTEKLMILDHDYNIMSGLHYSEGFGNVKTVTVKKNSHMLTELAVEHMYGFEIIEQRLNPYRYLKYPSLLLWYALSLGTLLILQKIFTARYNRRTAREQNMVNFQLQSVMNQLNPHFTFNAINTIGDSIMEGDRLEAYEYFVKLSGLIRKSMSNAFLPYKTLFEEIEFVKEYLQIEKFRFRDKLSWSLEIDPAVDTGIYIPKMLLHLFVENAVKHGIFHKKEAGRISIRISRNEGLCLIVIEDNGVGRKKASGLSRNKGQGLQIMDNYLDLFHQSQGTKISYFISDLEPGAKYPGTKVEIKIQYLSR